MGHDSDLLSSVPRRDLAYANQATLAKFCIAFAPGPAKIRIRLPEVPLPMITVLEPNLIQQLAFHLAAADFFQQRRMSYWQSGQHGDLACRVRGSPQGTRVQRFKFRVS